MQTPQQTVSSYRYVVGGLIVFLNFSIGLSFFAVSPLLPLVIDDYSVSRTLASLLMSLVILVQAIFSIPGGVLAARLDKKLTLGVGALLSSSVGLSWLAGGFGVLLALRVVYGLGMAVMWPATGPLIMQWFTSRERPLWNSLSMAACSSGMAVSMFIAAPLAEPLGWRGSLSVLSIATLAGAVLWLLFGRSADRPRAAQIRFSSREILMTLFSRSTLLIGLADASCYALYSALTSWLPTYYNEVRGMALTQVGLITGFLPFAGMLAVLAGGALAVKFQRRKPLLVLPGLFIGLAGFGSFLSSDLTLIYASVLLLGFVSWFWCPILFVIPMELEGATPSRVAMTWGMVGTLTSTMAFVSPLTVGAMTDALGTYIPGFSLWAGLSYCFLLSVLLLPETGRSAEAHPA